MYDAYKTTSDANDGSTSSSVTFPRAKFSESAMAKATEVLDAWRTGEHYMADRTFHVTGIQTEFDPHDVTTGMRVFDTQANRSGGFMTGNVFSNVQRSNYIRKFDQLQCNGITFDPGELRASDLKMFKLDRADERSRGDDNRADLMFAKVAEPALANETLIVYQVFHTVRDGTRKTHGWVITKADGDLVATIPCDTGARTAEILRRAVACFTMAAVPGSEKPLLKVDGGKLTFADPAVISASESVLGPMKVDSETGSYVPDAEVEERPRDRG